MNQEEITKTIDGLKPAIAAVTDPNARAIIEVLLQIIEAQNKIIAAQQKEIDSLKEKLNTNSSNSSNPPSTNRFKSGGKSGSKGGKGSNGKPGGQPGHKGVSRALLAEEEVDHIEQHQPPSVCSCGGAIEILHCYQRHQVHELPKIKIMVTEHQLMAGCCGACGQEHRATLPAHVPSGMLGPYLLALIATCTSDYKMSKRDVVRLFGDLFCLSLSVATIKRAEETVSQAIAPVVEEAKAFVQQQKIVNCDETSHAECGKKMWTWVAIANSVAVFMIAATRSTKAAKALLGEAFQGILGSDRYCAYTWVAADCRQVCWAHLIRDFKKIAERDGASKRIGWRLLVYSRQMFRLWHAVHKGTLSRAGFKEKMKPIRYAIEELLVAGTKIDHDKTRGTCFEILKVKVALWTFIDVVGVEPTNNLAERVLCKIVIWRKVCFGTWSANGTLYLERVMTVVATCRLQNRSVFHFLHDTIQAQLNNSHAPSLIPTEPTMHTSDMLDTDTAIAA